MAIENLKQNTLTICTVSFGHKRLIEENMKLVEKMNPGVFVRWIIVDNTPQNYGDTFEIKNTANVLVIKGIPNTFGQMARGSYHHASGLNLAIKEVESKYALILDPDFFIVSKNWITEVLNHMKDSSLGFFGAPYNPKRYLKYRYFPCIHCMFIDLEMVDKKKIDFSPDYADEKLIANRNKVETEYQSKIKLIYRIWNDLKSHLRYILKRQVIIGSSRDTGYKVYKNYSEAFKSECLQPVFKMSSSKIYPFYLKSFLNVFLESFLSEKLSYFPKKIGYFAKSSFSDLGFPEVFGRGWDEFLWKGRPFGFHMQGAKKDGGTTNHSDDMVDLSRILGYFIEAK
ncbi:MAG: hypothetical protein ABL917_03720 [Parcubacteria group bacterium]